MKQLEISALEDVHFTSHSGSIHLQFHLWPLNLANKNKAPISDFKIPYYIAQLHKLVLPVRDIKNRILQLSNSQI